MSVVSQSSRALRRLAARETRALQTPGGLRGIFGKAIVTGGKSQSKVLSSPADGIAHIEGMYKCWITCHVT